MLATIRGPAALILITAGISGCYRSVEVGREQIAQLAFTDPGRIALTDRTGHAHLLSEAQSLSLTTPTGPVDCTDWGPATSAIRCAPPTGEPAGASTMVAPEDVTSASLRVLSPARTTLIIAGPLAIIAGSTAGLFHWRGTNAKDTYGSLSPETPASTFADYRQRADRYTTARNVALAVAIPAGIGVVAGTLWGALFEE